MFNVVFAHALIACTNANVIKATAKDDKYFNYGEVKVSDNADVGFMLSRPGSSARVIFSHPAEALRQPRPELARRSSSRSDE